VDVIHTEGGLLAKERKYCTKCNEILDEKNYCQNCYLTVEDKNEVKLRRLNISYNLFQSVLFVATSYAVYILIMALFGEVIDRYREDTLFGIRFIIYVYALSPIITTFLFTLIKVVRGESPE
jgi:hypothetical protein